MGNETTSFAGIDGRLGVKQAFAIGGLFAMIKKEVCNQYSTEDQAQKNLHLYWQWSKVTEWMERP